MRKVAIPRLLVIALLLVALLLGGTAGYHWLEGWSALDSLYMTVITLTTVGFSEIQAPSPAGKVFTILLILGGVGAYAYAFSSLFNLFLSDAARKNRQRRRRLHMIDKLSDHVIVCGYGRMGSQISARLEDEQLPFVVIDVDEKAVELCERSGRHALHGNAANEETLKLAGISRACSLITVTDADAENVFVVLTARGLRPDLQIIARANYEDSEPKLLRAGANRVIMPYAIAGRRMVSLVTRPGVADFLDVVMHSPELELWLEEIVLSRDSPLEGRSLAEVNPRSEFGVTVLAIYPPDQPLLTYPDAPTRLQAGARLIAMGTRDGLQRFAKHASPA